MIIEITLGGNKLILILRWYGYIPHWFKCIKVGKNLRTKKILGRTFCKKSPYDTIWKKVQVGAFHILLWSYILEEAIIYKKLSLYINIYIY